MDINVKIVGDIPNASQNNFLIHLADADETVGDIKEKIARQLGLQNSSTIRLLFSGRFLSNNQQRASDLELGPSTFLNVMIANVCAVDENNISPISPPDDIRESRQWRQRFFVYCKNVCKELTPGKLRVRCAQCKSSSVLVMKEPNSWNDVLTRGTIQCQCLENRCMSDADSFYSVAAEFYFKCAHCSNEDGVVPLVQVKSIRKDASETRCSICFEGEENSRMVIFSCESAHAACLNCFVAYATEKLERRGFVMHPIYGYTLSCPEPRCRDGFVVDAHHFRLLGDAELYDKYHRLAAEIYLLGEGGVYCPRPNCGEAFISDLDVADEMSRATPRSEGDLQSPDRKMILCPKCGWAFCFYCRAGASECHCSSMGIYSRRGSSIFPHTRMSPLQSASDEAKSFVMIKWTTKPCPNCRAPTEKNEGCNHMTCVHCSFDWCWDCEKRWTEDCQWNHWFE